MVLAVAILLLGLFVYAGIQTAAQSYRLRQHARDAALEGRGPAVAREDGWVLRMLRSVRGHQRQRSA